MRQVVGSKYVRVYSSREDEPAYLLPTQATEPPCNFPSFACAAAAGVLPRWWAASGFRRARSHGLPPAPPRALLGRAALPRGSALHPAAPISCGSRLSSPDPTAFPLVPLAPFWDVLLSPGDLLYIPPLPLVVDLDAPDLTAFPLAPLAPFWDVLLSPGDLLYIPPRYWHYVKATRPSCSVSFWWKPTAQSGSK
ncbi:unnamed protein product [Closterium sp. Naga37s-1]|nr:unnamed protein product [Closterium sp. Naga37s-1]